MSTNHTKNYNLCQWEADDQVLRTEFNEDNAKIDAALKAEADVRAGAVSALTSQLAKLGNCRVETFTFYDPGTHTTGMVNPLYIPFSGRPILYVIFAPRFLWVGGRSQDAPQIYMDSGRITIISRNDTWTDDNRIASQSIQPGHSVTYQVVAFYAEDE